MSHNDIFYKSSLNRDQICTHLSNEPLKVTPLVFLILKMGVYLTSGYSYSYFLHISDIKAKQYYPKYNRQGVRVIVVLHIQHHFNSGQDTVLISATIFFWLFFQLISYSGVKKARKNPNWWQTFSRVQSDDFKQSEQIHLIHFILFNLHQHMYDLVQLQWTVPFKVNQKLLITNPSVFQVTVSFDFKYLLEEFKQANFSLEIINHAISL